MNYDIRDERDRQTTIRSAGHVSNISRSITDDELRGRILELEGFSRLSQAQASELADYRAALTIRTAGKERLRALAEQPGSHESRQTTHDRAAQDAADQPGEGGMTTTRTTDTTPAGRVRDLARNTIETAHRSGLLPDAAAATVERMLTRSSAAESLATAAWVNATGAPEYRSAFAKLLADPQKGHMHWTPEEQRAFVTVERYAAEQRAIGLGSGGGSYMVPLTLDPAIMLTGAGNTNPLRQVARVVTTATDSWQGVTSAGATAEWKAEAAEAADGSPTFDDAPIPVHTGDVFVPYSFEVGMDALDFTSELSRVMTDAAGDLMATAYTTGSGTGQPTGFVTKLAATAGSVVSPATSGVFAPDVDVYTLQEALPARFQAAASWQGNMTVLNTIDQAETTNGSKMFPELGAGQLLRRPVNENSGMASTGSMLAYGDFKQFVIVDRIGTTVELIPNLMGENGRPTGQRGLFLWFRTGSDVAVTNAFRLLKLS